MIEVSGLLKRYDRTQVLKGVSLSIPGAGMSVLVGHNGCGKTTLMKCLLGLARPDGGTVSFGGRAVNDASVRAGTGYMPQAGRYPSNTTGAEWLRLLAGIRGSEPPDRDRLLDAFALRPELDKPMGTLSGGTTQKLSAVISLMYRPDYLLMDEPTAGLDPVSRIVLKDILLERVKDGCTILLTSHVISEVNDLCNHLVWLQDGIVRFVGTAESVRETTGEPVLERALARLMSGTATTERERIAVTTHA